MSPPFDSSGNGNEKASHGDNANGTENNQFEVFNSLSESDINEIIVGSQRPSPSSGTVPRKRRMPAESTDGTKSSSHFDSRSAPPTFSEMAEDRAKRRRSVCRDFHEKRYRYKSDSQPPFVVLISQNSRDKVDRYGPAGSSENGSIGFLHPMIIGKRLRAHNSGVSEIRRRGRNLIEVTLDSYQEANRLVNDQASTLPESWKAHIPDSRVSRVGVARDVEPSLSEFEILEGLEWVGDPLKVLRVERIMRSLRSEGGENRRVPTSTIKIFFEGNVLPKKIIIFKTRVSIEPFEHRIKRCSKCQRFGHLEFQCRGKQKCEFCAGNHRMVECEASRPLCANCGGNHLATDQNSSHPWISPVSSHPCFVCVVGLGLCHATSSLSSIPRPFGGWFIGKGERDSLAYGGRSLEPAGSHGFTGLCHS